MIRNALALAALALAACAATAQTILDQMKNAPKLCDAPAAQAKFDAARLPAIKTNADSTNWSFSTLSVTDLRKDADQFAAFCVAEFVEIDGQIFFNGQPPLIVQDETRDRKTFFRFHQPKKCDIPPRTMIARSTSLPTWFFTNPSDRDGCIVCVKVGPGTTASGLNLWQILESQVFCKP